MIIRVTRMSNKELAALANDGKSAESRYAAASELLRRKTGGR